MPTASTVTPSSLSELLKQASGNTLIGLLSAELRWKLLIETCLGHAKVKNGRSRDYPFFKQRDMNCEFSQQLIAEKIRFTPGRKQDQQVTFSKYDLIVSIMLIEIASDHDFGESSIEEEKHYCVALRELIDILFPQNPETETELSYLNRLLGISGLGTDANESTKYYKETLRLAKVMASIARYDIQAQTSKNEALESIISSYGLRDEDITRLKSSNLDLIVLKNKQVQSYIDQCKLPFIQRGASYWCSQVLSQSRNQIEALHNKHSFVLTDCDSVSIQVVSQAKSDEEIRQHLVTYFCKENHQQHISQSYIESYYPRLIPYYTEAIKQALPTSEVIPNIGVEIRKQALIDLCIDNSLLKEFNHEGLNNAKVLTFKHPVSAKDNCSGRHNDTAFRHPDFSIPNWFNQGQNEQYGWASTVLSLVGMSYRQVTNVAMAKILSNRTDRSIDITRSHKALLSSVSAIDNSQANDLAYIKLDGDHIGRLFTSVSPILRPAISIYLELFIRDSWLCTLEFLIKKYDLNIIPADLLYFGGDDLFCVLPSFFLEEFLSEFQKRIDIKNSENQYNIQFSFACIKLSINDKSHRMNSGESVETMMFRVVNRLLTIIKTTPPEQWNITQHQALQLLPESPITLSPSLKGAVMKAVPKQIEQ